MGGAKAEGNYNANGAQRVWAVEGTRNLYASIGTSEAIAAAAANGKKAYFAASFGAQASKATSMRAAHTSAFTAKSGARHLLRGQAIPQDLTSIVNSNLAQDALSSKSLSHAATQAASGSTSSSNVRAGEFTGARRLHGDRTDRQDRNSIAIQATSDTIQSAVGRKSVSSATKAGVVYSKLATSNSVRAGDFTGA
jgi:hypothetical protein